jgi:hypothetical protein
MANDAATAVGDKVKYAAIRETQRVNPDLKHATYVVDDFGKNDAGEEIVKALPPWGGHCWILKAWLQKVQS